MKPTFSSVILLAERTVQMAGGRTFFLGGLNRLAKEIKKSINRGDKPFVLTREYLLENNYGRIALAISGKNTGGVRFMIEDTTLFPDERSRQRLILGSIRFAIRHLSSRGLPVNEKAYNFSSASSGSGTLRSTLKIFPLAKPYPIVRIEIYRK